MFVVASQNWFTFGLSHRLICLFKARWRQLERQNCLASYFGAQVGNRKRSLYLSQNL